MDVIQCLLSQDQRSYIHTTRIQEQFEPDCPRNRCRFSSRGHSHHWTITDCADLQNNERHIKRKSIPQSRPQTLRKVAHKLLVSTCYTYRPPSPHISPSCRTTPFPYHPPHRVTHFAYPTNLKTETRISRSHTTRSSSLRPIFSAAAAVNYAPTHASILQRHLEIKPSARFSSQLWYQRLSLNFDHVSSRRVKRDYRLRIIIFVMLGMFMHCRVNEYRVATRSDWTTAHIRYFPSFHLALISKCNPALRCWVAARYR
jgi:hypothetical protein